MPIEIRELVIKATLSNDAQNGAAGEQTSGNSQPVVSDALVNACVEKVMEIIKQKTER